MPNDLLLALVIFAAAFLQYTSGFGFALVAMPLCTLLFGVRTAAPLVALAGVTVQIINVVRFRRDVNWREFLKLALTAALGVPIGVWGLSAVDARLVKTALGVLLIGYGLYNLLKPQSLRLVDDRWVYGVGFVAGCLGGAFNTSGPPVAVYGSLKGWPKDEFRSTLQTFFFTNSLVVIAGHLAAGHYNREIMVSYLVAVPALLIGNFAGARVDHKVNASVFRAIVTIMILASGVILVL